MIAFLYTGLNLPFYDNVTTRHYHVLGSVRATYKFITLKQWQWPLSFLIVYC